MPYWANFPPGGVNGSSGLRLTFLTSLKTPLANGVNGVDNTKVLSVDANGDVVLVNANSLSNANNGIYANTTGNALQLGGDCSNSTQIIASAFTTNRAIDLNANNFEWRNGRVGFGTTSCVPNNRVEIAGLAANQSGLRFTNMTTANVPATNPGLGVLSVDAYGDVIYVPDFNHGFGNACSSGPSNLPTDWRVGMNGYSMNFAGTGNVNIGDLNTCLPGSSSPARLWVRNSFGAPNPNTGFRVDNVGIPGTYAGYFGNGDVYCTGNTFSGAGFTVSDKNIKTNINTIKSPMEIINKLRPVSYKFDNTYAPQLTFDGNINYGFIAQEVAGVVPELVKSTMVFSGFDSLGNTVGTDITLNALNYSAIIPFAIGGIQELGAKQNEILATLAKAGLSDAQVKTNIAPFNALTKIKTLSPVMYNFTNANVPQLNFTPNTDYGFIAQQLQTVYPELVDTVNIPAKLDSVGNVVNVAKTLKTVNYKAMSALLVRAVQELQFKVDSLNNKLNVKDSLQDARLSAIENRLNQCCSNAGARSANPTLNSLDIDLSDKDAIVLNQNVPNPFAEQTTITYNVPEKVGKAQILFFNAAGQIIQTVDVKTRGKGKINVFASDLSSGLYHYSLVADGVIIDRKKMVRE
jgi:hypothetical protein